MNLSTGIAFIQLIRLNDRLDSRLRIDSLFSLTSQEEFAKLMCQICLFKYVEKLMGRRTATATTNLAE